MSRLAFLRLAGCALLAAAAAGRVRAQALVSDINEFVAYTAGSQGSAGYNLITLGNASLSGSSDTNGAIAIGGNLTLNGTWTIASHDGMASDPSLYVKGSTSFSGLSQLQNGYATLPYDTTTHGYTWSSTAETLSHSGSAVLHMETNGSAEQSNPQTNHVPTDVNLATSGTSSFAGIAADLALATSTSAGASISVQGQTLNFNTTATSGVVVFDLDASILTSRTYNGDFFSGVSISVPSGVNYVINVTNLASTENFSNLNFNAGTNDSQLLWNFGTATSTVTLAEGGQFYGSVLAPNVNLVDQTTINGTVVVNSFTDNGVELHDDDAFQSVVVPESGGYALWGLALCLAVVVGGGAGRRLLLSRARS
ncbi:MAG TPA: collagen-binding domain-containing protein [Opitutaceae bacterium]|nr:collagen-binding domain-containing protein [Opitutaceae bacterium]